MFGRASRSVWKPPGYGRSEQPPNDCWLTGVGVTSGAGVDVTNGRDTPPTCWPAVGAAPPPNVSMAGCKLLGVPPIGPGDGKLTGVPPTSKPGGNTVATAAVAPQRLERARLGRWHVSLCHRRRDRVRNRRARRHLNRRRRVTVAVIVAVGVCVSSAVAMGGLVASSGTAA